MKKKVSVIVPVYNAEKTLVRCLGNLVNQTLKEIEIVLVDDCSVDQSWLLMQVCKQKYPDKIILLQTKENLGPGGARNLALQQVTGEYIGFVDSDDYVDISLYEKMYLTAKDGNFDLVDCGFYYEANNQGILYTSDELTGEWDARKRSELMVAGGYLWSKLFARELFTQDKVRFREHAILEDMDFLLYLLMTSKKVGNVKEVLYRYCDFSDSASKEKDPEQYYHQVIEAMRAVYERLHTRKEYQYVQEAIEYAILNLYLSNLVLCIQNKATPNFNWKEKMIQLSKEKCSIISMDYKDNRYVQNKMTKRDIQYMQMCDSLEILNM